MSDPGPAKIEKKTNVKMKNKLFYFVHKSIFCNMVALSKDSEETGDELLQSFINLKDWSETFSRHLYTLIYDFFVEGLALC